MIVATLNGAHALGFAEAAEQRDGSVHRRGRLQLHVNDFVQLDALIDSAEPMIYAGPVWINGTWRNESFQVVPRLNTIVQDGLAIVSITECDGVSRRGIIAASHSFHGPFPAE
jgi:hypothetical protein